MDIYAKLLTLRINHHGFLPQRNMKDLWRLSYKIGDNNSSYLMKLITFIKLKPLCQVKNGNPHFEFPIQNSDKSIWVGHDNQSP